MKKNYWSLSYPIFSKQAEKCNEEILYGIFHHPIIIWVVRKRSLFCVGFRLCQRSFIRFPFHGKFHRQINFIKITLWKRERKYDVCTYVYVAQNNIKWAQRNEHIKVWMEYPTKFGIIFKFRTVHSHQARTSYTHTVGKHVKRILRILAGVWMYVCINVLSTRIWNMFTMPDIFVLK